MATVSTLSVVIDGDSSKLLSALASSSAATKLFASSASVPLAAAGAAIAGVGAIAVGMAMDFDKSFTRISALSNASAQDIERWKGEVLDLAGETAEAPKELADALFFLSSAGLEASEIMPALEVSAKAAAVGLGETEDIANIVASALNAYADAGLEAADVTDTLVAAVREGRAEPEEFAGALGRILPIASQAGVSFDNVTASLAALSNIGLDVNEGVTAMRGALQAIVAPGSMAAEAMKQIGLTAQDMLDAIDERGLLGAIQMLDQAARDNTETQADYINVLRQVVPNVRALTGVLGLTGQEAEKVEAIFDRVKKSTGALDEAFSTVEQSAGFLLKQGLQRIGNSLLRLGEMILPTVVDAFGFVADAVDFANDALQPLFDAINAVTGAEIDNAAATKAAQREHSAWYDEYQRLIGLVHSNEMTWDEFKVRIDEVSMAYGQGHATSVLFRAAQEELARRMRDDVAALDDYRRSELDRQGAVKSGIIAQRDMGGALQETATELSEWSLVPIRREVKQFAGMTKKAISEWRTDMVADFRGTFLDIQNAETDIFDMTANEFIRDAERMADNAMTAAEDMDALADIKPGEDFKAWLMTQGPAAIHAFVAASEDGRDAIVEDWRRTVEAAKLYEAAADKATAPRVQHVTWDDKAARQQASNFNGYLDGILTDREVTVIVHTKGGSPMPDEALKLHLIDPMQRMGFKRKGDRWELPLDVNVHTGLKTKDAEGPHGFIGSAVEAIADATTVKESKDWADAMRDAMASSVGRVSDRERTLIRSAAQAIADVTTAKEAQGWTQMMRRRALGGLEQGDLEAWREERARSRQENREWAVSRLPGLKDVHRAVRRDERMDIHLDRKRFAEELSYDASYRGW